MVSFAETVQTIRNSITTDFPRTVNTMANWFSEVVNAGTDFVSKFYSNGTPTVGIGAGMEAPLREDAYIRIPSSWCKMLSVTGATPPRIGDDDRTPLYGMKDHLVESTTYSRYGKFYDITKLDKAGKPIEVAGPMFCKLNSNMWEPAVISNSKVDFTKAMYIDFIVANRPPKEVRKQEDEVVYHGGRAACVLFGTVGASEDDCEALVVGKNHYKWDPNDPEMPRWKAIAALVHDNLPRFHTLVIAGAVTWKLTNHTLGGQNGQINGFTQKTWDVLMVAVGVPRTADMGGNANHYAQICHSAIHAASKRNIFAMVGCADGQVRRTHVDFLPIVARVLMDDTAALRISTPPAGTHWFSTIYAGLMDVAKLGLVPLMPSQKHVGAFVTGYEEVVKLGMRAHAGASWFYNGTQTTFKRVSQKADFVISVGVDVAAVIKALYPKGTLAQSPIIDQLSKDQRKDTGFSDSMAALGDIGMPTLDLEKIKEHVALAGSTGDAYLVLEEIHTITNKTIQSKLLRLMNSAQVRDGSEPVFSQAEADEVLAATNVVKSIKLVIPGFEDIVSGKSHINKVDQPAITAAAAATTSQTGHVYEGDVGHAAAERATKKAARAARQEADRVAKEEAEARAAAASAAAATPVVDDRDRIAGTRYAYSALMDLSAEDARTYWGVNLTPSAYDFLACYAPAFYDMPGRDIGRIVTGSTPEVALVGSVFELFLERVANGEVDNGLIQSMPAGLRGPINDAYEDYLEEQDKANRQEEPGATTEEPKSPGKPTGTGRGGTPSRW